MIGRKLQTAGGPLSQLAESDGRGHTLLYSGVALGLVAGAAISAYLWKQRAHALNLLNATPLERAEELIASCEHKIEDIERALEDIKAAARPS